jgi:hypothetical protein
MYMFLRKKIFNLLLVLYTKELDKLKSIYVHKDRKSITLIYKIKAITVRSDNGSL